MSKNKRLDGERVQVEMLVDYNSDGTFLFDFCKDLGAGGIFISSMNPKSPGEVVELTFTIPDNKKTLKLKGKVMWSQKPGISDKKSGMGIQFTDYSRTERKILEEFIARYGS